MPVILPSLPVASARPSPPRSGVWLVLFVAILAAGAACTLLTWPKGTPTDTVGFWARLLAFPALAGSFLYGLRRLYHDQETARLQADERALASARAAAIAFAQEPLAVLGRHYLCAMGSDDIAGRIVTGEVMLASCRGPGTVASIRHTHLALDGDTREARFAACFKALLSPLQATLASLPPRAPLAVYLDLPAEAEGLPVLWQQCWSAAGHRPVTTMNLTQGVMALDAWLDRPGGPSLETFVLVVAVQLHETPPADSAEAAVALLLSWAPLAERAGLPVQAHLHRPVAEDGGEFESLLSHTLLWGNAEATAVNDLWQANLAPDDHARMMQAASGLSPVPLAAAMSQRIHDLDTAIGRAAVAAPWLAIALAVEHASRTHTPQLVASRQHTLCAAIVQPHAPSQDTHHG